MDNENYFNFIQWKGTDVCIDIYCPECGYHSHFDGEFMYYYVCPKCKSCFEMGHEVSMKKMDAIPKDKCVQYGELNIMDQLNKNGD